MSTKQIARSVHDGRLVTFHIPGSENISGYVAGMDDFHWLVLTPDGKEHLVHKSGASVVTIASQPTYAEEVLHADLERVIEPFRKRLVDKNLIPPPRRLRPTTASERTA